MSSAAIGMPDALRERCQRLHNLLEAQKSLMAAPSSLKSDPVFRDRVRGLQERSYAIQRYWKLIDRETSRRDPNSILAAHSPLSSARSPRKVPVPVLLSSSGTSTEAGDSAPRARWDGSLADRGAGRFEVILESPTGTFATRLVTSPPPLLRRSLNADDTSDAFGMDRSWEGNSASFGNISSPWAGVFTDESGNIACGGFGSSVCIPSVGRSSGMKRRGSCCEPAPDLTLFDDPVTMELGGGEGPVNSEGDAAQETAAGGKLSGSPLSSLVGTPMVAAARGPRLCPIAPGGVAVAPLAVESCEALRGIAGRLSDPSEPQELPRERVPTPIPLPLSARRHEGVGAASRPKPCATHGCVPVVTPRAPPTEGADVLTSSAAAPAGCSAGPLAAVAPVGEPGTRRPLIVFSPATSTTSPSSSPLASTRGSGRAALRHNSVSPAESREHDSSALLTLIGENGGAQSASRDDAAGCCQQNNSVVYESAREVSAEAVRGGNSDLRSPPPAPARPVHINPSTASPPNLPLWPSSEPAAHLDRPAEVKIVSSVDRYERELMNAHGRRNSSRMKKVQSVSSSERSATTSATSITEEKASAITQVPISGPSGGPRAELCSPDDSSRSSSGTTRDDNWGAISIPEPEEDHMEPV